MKIIVAIAVVAALMVGGVIDVKVYPARLPQVPSRLLALVEGEQYLEQGQEYVKNLFTSLKSDDSTDTEEGDEEKKSDVAGAQDEQEDPAPKKTDKEPKIKFEGVSVPLRF